MDIKSFCDRVFYILWMISDLCCRYLSDVALLCHNMFMPNSVTAKMQRAMSRLPQVDTIPIPSLVAHESAEDAAYGAVNGANLLFALQRAQKARELAVSYRDFNVGASVLSYTINPLTARLLSGINVNPQKNGELNMHAEQLVLQKIKDWGANLITLITVVGEVQADTQSGFLAKTLHPCGLCREALDQSGYVDDDRTIVASALPDLRTLEMYSFGALKEFHKTGDFIDIYQARLPNLELLTPFVPPIDGSPVALDESPQMRQEEEIWESAVGIPLLNYRLTGQWPAQAA